MNSWPSKSPPPFQQKLAVFSRFAGTMSVVVGLLVFTGWVLDVPLLKSFVPGLTAMKANTALAFILAGVSLGMSQCEDAERDPVRRFVALVCASVVTAMGLLTLGEYVLGKDFGIDQLFVRDWRGSSGPFPPGRIPPIASLNLVAVGTGLLLLDVKSKKDRRPTEFLALLVGLGGLLGLLDMSYDFKVLYTGMAPNGILTFWVLAVGLLGARPQGRLAKLLSGEGVGAVTTRRLLPASIVIPLFLGWLRAQGQRMGLFGTEFGTGLMVLVNIVILAAMVLVTAQSLDKTDVERRRAEAELQRFFTLSLDMLCIMGFDGYFKRLNPAWEHTLGFTAEELRAGPFLNLVHPDDREATAAELKRLSAGLETIRFENRCRTKDGSYRWLLWNAAPYRGQRLIYAVAHDITERKRTEAEQVRLLQKTEAAEAKFRSLLELAPDGILIANPAGNIVLVNRKVEELFGYRREELLGMAEEMLIPGRLRKGHTEVRLGYYAHPETRAMHGAPDLLGRRKDGSEFPVEISLSPVQSEGEILVMAVVHDITERKRAEDSLHELRRQNELILNSAGEGICRLAPDGRCTFANPTAARLVGREVDELVGGDLHAIAHHTRPDGSPYAEVDCPALLALKDGKARCVSDEVFWRKDGSSFPAEYICTPIRENNQVAGVVVTFRDITERRSVEQMKDEFISVVGHELRTPLTSIRGALGLLASGHLGELPAKSQRMLEVAVTNTDRLVRLINDVLDIERMESGKVSLTKQPCNVPDLVEQAVEVMRPLAERANVVLSASPEPVWVEADPDGILQTLTNLLSNAIKFSPSGGTVSVAAQRQGNEVLFQIKDQGRGIPPEKIERIFGRFQQVDASDSRQRGGTGLGLAICRSIVQRHRGRIWAESQVGVGSTFFFTLPIGQEPQPEAPESHNAGKPLVLVCDDDPSDRRTVQELLERRGYRVAAVASGEEAIEQATAQKPAIIVLDLMMPGMNGWETTAALKEREETRNIPIVISSLLSPEESSQSPAHVTAWLRKPLEEGSLTQVLEMALHEQ